MENTIYRHFLSVIQCYYNLMCLGGKYRIIYVQSNLWCIFNRLLKTLFKLDFIYIKDASISSSLNILLMYSI